MRVLHLLPFLSLLISNVHARPTRRADDEDEDYLTVAGLGYTQYEPLSFIYRCYRTLERTPEKDSLVHKFGEDRVSQFAWDMSTAIEENRRYGYHLLPTNLDDKIGFVFTFKFVSNDNHEIETFDQTAVAVLVEKIILQALAYTGDMCGSIWATSCMAEEHSPEVGHCSYIDIRAAVHGSTRTDSCALACAGFNDPDLKWKNWGPNVWDSPESKYRHSLNSNKS